MAGGRYDGLVELMGGPAMPGVGWAAGIERLAMLIAEPPTPPRPIALVPIGEAAEARMLRLAEELRDARARRRSRLFRQCRSGACGGPTGSAPAPRCCSATTSWRSGVGDLARSRQRRAGGGARSTRIAGAAQGASG